MGEVDWPAVVGATSVFVTTGFLTWKGWRDRKVEIDEPPALSHTQVVPGIIQDNASIRENTEAIRALTVEIRRHSDLVLLIRAVKDD